MQFHEFHESTRQEHHYTNGATLTLPGLDAQPEKKRLTTSQHEEAARKRHKDAEQRKATAKASRRREKPNKYRTPDPATKDETEFRHSAWKDKREQVAAALAEAGTGANAMYNFLNCGAECIVCFDNEEKRYFLQGKYCHSRYCEPCMRAKANLLAANFREITEAAEKHTFRFLTLTLKHSDEPLTDQIAKLRKSFNALRKLPLWTNNCTGGCGILETKWMKDTGEFHPHLHVIMQGDPIKKNASAPPGTKSPATATSSISRRSTAEKTPHSIWPNTSRRAATMSCGGTDTPPSNSSRP